MVGLLPGSQRPDEVVTLTSHYDHFGIGEPIDGDSIYNGAYDNASGTAMLIEIARGFAALAAAARAVAALHLHGGRGAGPSRLPVVRAVAAVPAGQDRRRDQHGRRQPLG